MKDDNKDPEVEIVTLSGTRHDGKTYPPNVKLKLKASVALPMIGAGRACAADDKSGLARAKDAAAALAARGKAPQVSAAGGMTEAAVAKMIKDASKASEDRIAELEAKLAAAEAAAAEGSGG